jgi:hypothetical protein
MKIANVFYQQQRMSRLISNSEILSCQYQTVVRDPTYAKRPPLASSRSCQSPLSLGEKKRLDLKLSKMLPLKNLAYNQTFI